MSWVKIDDRANEHRKQLEAGPAASWLWACGLMYANRQTERTGVIPDVALPVLFPGATRKLASKLVDVGLWELCDGGYRIHNYFEFQPTPEEVASRKDARASAARIAANARWDANRDANGMREPCDDASRSHNTSMRKNAPDPDPDPDPDPILIKNNTSKPKRLSASAGDLRGTRISTEWQPKAETLEGLISEGHTDPSKHVREFVDFWIGVPGAKGKKLDWEATFRNRVREVSTRHARTGQRSFAAIPIKQAYVEPSEDDLRRQREFRESGGFG